MLVVQGPDSAAVNYGPLIFCPAHECTDVSCLTPESMETKTHLNIERIFTETAKLLLALISYFAVDFLIMSSAEVQISSAPVPLSLSHPPSPLCAPPSALCSFYFFFLLGNPTMLVPIGTQSTSSEEKAPNYFCFLPFFLQMTHIY